MSEGRYRLYGTNGSPYSVKLRAILRYRRLPFDWILRTERNNDLVVHVRPAVIPILQFPEDGHFQSDSTPLAYLLEERHSGARSIVPDDPGHAFLSHLIEDFADEWMTKPLFWYRWARDVDVAYSRLWIADDFFPDQKGDARKAVADGFAQRQIGRMALVGCTQENAPIIEASYERVLGLLEPHVGLHDYLFGSRPALADFGLFGQLMTLAQDVTPQAIMRDRAQRVESWVRQLDDASGIEGEWLSAEAPLPEATQGLLRLIGEIYLPFLAANAKAFEAGLETVTLDLLGVPYRQAPFKYQVKCLADLRQRFQALHGAAKERSETILDETGCLGWLTAT
ncbi:MAG: glutathione S-transferase N-terminal domain-containing protein [Alphaproteobacteria bacterium]|nr:glutathione S-transferase N-terminal domain-containing protein [Alphaproteobacteria bacterium]